MNRSRIGSLRQEIRELRALLKTAAKAGPRDDVRSA